MCSHCNTAQKEVVCHLPQKTQCQAIRGLGNKAVHLGKDIIAGYYLINLIRDHSGRVVTLSPPTSEAGVRFPAWPQVGKAGSCLPLVGSLQYRTLTNCMYWFPLPFQLPVVM